MWGLWYWNLLVMDRWTNWPIGQIGIVRYQTWVHFHSFLFGITQVSYKQPRRHVPNIGALYFDLTLWPGTLALYFDLIPRLRTPTADPDRGPDWGPRLRTPTQDSDWWEMPKKFKKDPGRFVVVVWCGVVFCDNNTYPSPTRLWLWLRLGLGCGKKTVQW